MSTPEPPLDLARRRNVGQLLDLTFKLFGRHSGLFLSVTLLVVAPVVVLVDGAWGGQLESGPDAHPTSGVQGLSLLLTLVMPVLVTAMHAVIVRDIGNGRVPEVGTALRAAAPRFLPALAAVLLYTIGFAVGLLLLVIPGIIVWVRWYFAAQAAVLDGVGPGESIRRSSALVEGRWWEVFGALLVSAILLGGGTALLALPVHFVHEGIAYVTLSAVVQSIGLSLAALYGTLLFFSLRVPVGAPALEPLD
jgi:hypothetical protein